MIRPITIRSRYEQAECAECGGTITLDFGPEGYDGEPIEVTDDGGHEDGCSKLPPEAPEIEAMSVQVHKSGTPGQFVAFLYPNAETTVEHLNIGLVYGATRYEAAGKMMGILDQLGWLAGRTIPVVFQEG